MKKRLWDLFLKVIWPHIRPIIEKYAIKIAKRVCEWLLEQLDNLLSKMARERKEYAQKKQAEAESKAARSASKEDRARAEGEACAWKESIRREEDALDFRGPLDEIRSKLETQIVESLQSAIVQEKIEKEILSLPVPTNFKLSSRDTKKNDQ